MLSAISSYLDGFLERSLAALGLSEKRCALCHEPYIPLSPYSPSPFPSSLLCPDCQKSLPAFHEPRCAGCGLPLGESQKLLPASGSLSLCPACRKSPPPWQGVGFYGLYAGKLREAVLALKYSGNLHLCPLFSDLLMESSKCLPAADLLVPVPVSISRLKERGFNQALEIGRCLSRQSAIPISCRALFRVRETGPQEGLNARERKKNMQGVFRASREASNRSIWILDDVMTTGSTLVECSRALLDMGAASVSLLFLARTPEKTE